MKTPNTVSVYKGDFVDPRLIGWAPSGHQLSSLFTQATTSGGANLRNSSTGEGFSRYSADAKPWWNPSPKVPSQNSSNIGRELEFVKKQVGDQNSAILPKKRITLKVTQPITTAVVESEERKDLMVGSIISGSDDSDASSKIPNKKKKHVRWADDTEGLFCHSSDSKLETLSQGSSDSLVDEKSAVEPNSAEEEGNTGYYKSNLAEFDPCAPEITKEQGEARKVVVIRAPELGKLLQNDRKQIWPGIYPKNDYRRRDVSTGKMEIKSAASDNSAEALRKKPAVEPNSAEEEGNTDYSDQNLAGFDPFAAPYAPDVLGSLGSDLLDALQGPVEDMPPTPEQTREKSLHLPIFAKMEEVRLDHLKNLKSVEDEFIKILLEMKKTITDEGIEIDTANKVVDYLKRIETDINNIHKEYKDRLISLHNDYSSHAVDNELEDEGFQLEWDESIKESKAYYELLEEYQEMMLCAKEKFRKEGMEIWEKCNEYLINFPKHRDPSTQTNFNEDLVQQSHSIGAGKTNAQVNVGALVRWQAQKSTIQNLKQNDFIITDPLNLIANSSEYNRHQPLPRQLPDIIIDQLSIAGSKKQNNNKLNVSLQPSAPTKSSARNIVVEKQRSGATKPRDVSKKVENLELHTVEETTAAGAADSATEVRKLSVKEMKKQFEALSKPNLSSDVKGHKPSRWRPEQPEGGVWGEGNWYYIEKDGTKHWPKGINKV